MAKQRTFSDQLRRVIDDCEMSRYRLAIETGVSEAQLCRFMAGEGLGVVNIDALCAYLKLDLMARARAPRKKGR